MAETDEIDDGTAPALSLAWTVGVSTAVTALALIAALKFFPRAEVYSGIVAGWLTAVLNYLTLVKIIRGLLSEGSGRGKIKMAGFLVLKLALLIAIIAVAFWWIKVDVLAFVAGYMCLISVALGLGLVNSSKA